jgi:hypothetical protein
MADAVPLLLVHEDLVAVRGTAVRPLERELVDGRVFEDLVEDQRVAPAGEG